MRSLVVVLTLVGCGGNLTDDDQQDGYAFVTPASDYADVRFARATTGIAMYGGIAYYRWTIVLGTGDGCDADTAATFEINTPVAGSKNQFPIGTFPIRADEVPEILPSTLVRFGDATGVSGSITIDSIVEDRIDGTADVTLTTGAITVVFIAHRCP